MKHTNWIVTTTARILFGGLIAVEMLAWVGVLNIDLDFTWAGLILTASVAWIFVELIIRYVNRHTRNTWSGWVLLYVTFPVYFDAIGDMAGFYALYERYDQLAHFSGGFAAMGVMSFLVRSYFKAQKIRLPAKVLFLSSLALTTLAGVLYEVEEFTEDVFFDSNRLGDAHDTVFDLILNLTGGILMGYIVSRVTKNTPSKRD